MKKLKMKNIIKSILFIVILLIMLISLSYVFLYEGDKDGFSTIGIAGEKYNTIDFVVIGDSESYMSIAPIEIWKQYGYTGYVRGSAAQKLCKTYDLLKETLRNQQPKVVIIETNAIFRNYKISKLISTELSSVFPLTEYHDRWKTWIDKDMINKLTSDSKGYYYSNEVKSVNGKGYMRRSKISEKIPKKNMVYLNKIFNLCEKNNIKVILLSTPSVRNWNYEKHNSIQEIAQKNNIDYLDMNLSDDVNINWTEDTKDRGDHLNYSGAKKVTMALGNYLEQLHILEDHRNDERYDNWRESAERKEN